MTDNTTKAISQSATVDFGFRSNPTSTRKRRTGALISQIWSWIGLISVSKVSWFLGMSHTRSSACRLPQLPRPSILWLLLSAQSTFILDVYHLFSGPLPTHTPTVRYGFAVFLRKSVPFNISIRTAKPPWVNIVLFARKELPRPSQQCVSWLSNAMKISIHYRQNLGSSFLETTRSMFGAKATALLPSSAATPFDSRCQRLSRSATLFARVIVRMPFAKGILPPEEVTIVQPLLSDPKAEPNEYWLLLQTLYGLCRSPQHGYDKINKILISIGLTPFLEDPCLFTGFVWDPNDPDGHVSEKPLSLGLYLDDFVYFFEDPYVKKLFYCLLSERCKVDFMGIVEWFLGVHFLWRISSSLVSVHLNQSGFASNLVESFFSKTP
jgi:hypothetical protein